ncbi:MAG: cytochrome c [Wenzhouxiangellaceae bacterium]|nr:cytochrome c [Wenzhouxiangellaceae bacterium]
MTNFKTISLTVIATLLAVVIAVIAFTWSGLYPVAANSGHIAPIGWLLETTRKRSIAVRASGLVVPQDLGSSNRIATGAGHYKEMCAGCHGAPGVDPAGAFNPAPPALYRHRVKPREAFWTVKHGLKMTAMPSHLDHSDADNWDTVAFLQALPDMSANEYTQVTEQANHEHANGQEHDHGAQASGQVAGSLPDAKAHDDSANHDHDGDTSHGHADGEDLAPSNGDTGHDHGNQAATAEATIEAFHHALAEGRGDDALGYLHPRAVITEGGRVETVEHYAGGHIKGDMEFLGQLSIETIAHEVLAKSETQATISSQSRMRGQIRDQVVDVLSSEAATLVKTDKGWRILHLAWSSRPYSEG